MASLKNIKEGQILYDVHSYKNNNGQSTKGMWAVEVLEVQKNGALCSWNGNPARYYSERKLKALKVNKPN